MHKELSAKGSVDHIINDVYAINCLKTNVWRFFNARLKPLVYARKIKHQHTETI